MEDHFENQYKWCPACFYRLMKANERYVEGPFKGDQDKSIAEKMGYTKPPQVGLLEKLDH